MEMLGLDEKEKRVLDTIVNDVVKSSELEGYQLNAEQVRSSIAHRLDMPLSDTISSTRNVDRVVEMMIDAIQNYEKPLTEDRLFGWHSCLFPSGYSGMTKINVGQYRKKNMAVISGSTGKEKVHFEAPVPEKVNAEMEGFISWINAENNSMDSFVKAAVAHLWFVTIHPFDDGNGRIARTLSDMLLCRGDKSQLRYYSLSAEIVKEKTGYYDILERTQKGNLEITEWIEWFLNCILRSIEESNRLTDTVLQKYSFLHSIENITLNKRQRLMLQKMLSPDWLGVLNTSKWSKITKCSSDTALRDITDLIDKGILRKATEGGRSTNYVLICPDTQKR